MSQLPRDLCTLVWPELETVTWPPLVASGNSRWLIGWNPRGLVVVAAALLDAPTCTEARALLRRRKDAIEATTHTAATRRAEDAQAVSRSLRVLGRLRGTQDVADDDVKTLRQQSDVWLELALPGPSVTELYCCGYKVHQYHLHVIHCDPTCHKIMTTPSVFTVLDHYGHEGVRAMIQSGVRPYQVHESESRFEGVMMPKHLQQIIGHGPSGGHSGLEMLRMASAVRPEGNSPGTTPAPSPFKAGSATGGSTDAKKVGPLALANRGGQLAPPPALALPGRDEPPADDSFGSEPVAGAVAAGAAAESGSFSSSNSQMALPPSMLKGSAATEPTTPGADERWSTRSNPNLNPPRLDFPERTDLTELSCWLFLCNAASVLRQRLSTSDDADEGSADAAPQSLPSRTQQQQQSLQRASAGTSSEKPSYQAHLWPVRVLLFVLLTLLPLLRALAHVSYVFRMVEYRCRECVNWLALLCGRSTSCGLHPVMPHVLDSRCPASQRRSCLWSFVFRVVGDGLLGVVLSGLLIQYRQTIVTAIQSVAWYGLYDLHVGYLTWFRGWPAGFKMNDDLNVAISAFNMAALVSWRDMITWFAVDWIAWSYAALAVVTPFGASYALCFVSDCCNLVTQHLRLLFHIMEVVYHAFVSLLSCLIAQFRGMKLNPLRSRTDAFEFGMDQMLLGTLLCTATLFLFPTVALYYFYLALVRTSVWVVQESLFAVAVACSNLPLFQVAHWLYLRKSLPSGIELARAELRVPTSAPRSPATSTLLRPSSSSSPVAPPVSAQVVVDIHLRTIPMPLASALFDVDVVRWALMQPFSVPKLLRFIVLGEERPCINLRESLYPHLWRDPVKPSPPPSE